MFHWPGETWPCMIYSVNLYVTRLSSVILSLPDHPTPSSYPNNNLNNNARLKARFHKRMPITEHSEFALPYRAPRNVQTRLLYGKKRYEEVIYIKGNFKKPICQFCLESRRIVTKQSFIFQENRWCRH